MAGDLQRTFVLNHSAGRALRVVASWIRMKVWWFFGAALGGVVGNSFYAGELAPSVSKIPPFASFLWRNTLGASFPGYVLLGSLVLIGFFVFPRRERSPGGTTFLGIDVGRTKIAWGVLRVNSPRRGSLPTGDSVEPIVYADVKLPSPDRLYDTLAEIAGHVCSSHQLDGIGVGLPGQIDPVAGIAHDSPGFLRRDEDFISRLCEQLAKDTTVCASLGALAHREDKRRSKLRSKILIDNDARCAIRHVHSERLRDRRWRNFACVAIGKGVGAGLVLDKSLFYGSRWTAGEIGHMCLHLDAKNHHEGTVYTDHLTGRPIAHQPGMCKCGKEGVHWESLVSGAGFVSLAWAVDADTTRDLANAWGVAATDLEAHHIGLAARVAEHGAVDGGVRSPPVDVMNFADDSRGKEYLGTVLDVYSRYVGVGLAALVNAYNLDHIVLAGGLMDGLWPLDRIRKGIRTHIGSYALDFPIRALEPIDHGGDDRPSKSWRGAALLFRDPSFSRSLARSAG